MDRAVFTIATGKPIYLEMAFALARSFKLWHSCSEIRFFLATDTCREQIPADLNDIELIRITPGQFGVGFTPKLFLDEMAPTNRSIFVDADCLCVGSLEQAFEEFSGHAVSVIGREIRSGEWFGDVAALCRRFNVTGIPRFNGGVYYLERGEVCSQVYSTARKLLEQYDEIGFVRLRGHPNDEVLLSLAMAIEQQKPIPERGDIMNSLLAGPAGLEIDVFKGRAILKNPKGHPQRNLWYEQEELRPRLVHFLGTDVTTYPYKHEIIRLRLVCGAGWPVTVSTLWAQLTFSWLWRLREGAKKVVRPLFRRVFGIRQSPTSSRG